MWIFPCGMEVFEYISDCVVISFNKIIETKNSFVSIPEKIIVVLLWFAKDPRDLITSM